MDDPETAVQPRRSTSGVESLVPRWTLPVVLGCLIAEPLVLGVCGFSPGTIWASVTACAAAAVLIRLPDLELFEVGPLKARLRAAEKDLSELQSLAVALAQPLLGSIASEGRLAGKGHRLRSFRTRDAVLKHLTDMNMKAGDIMIATETFDGWTQLDLADDIQRQAGETLRDNLPLAETLFECVAIPPELKVCPASEIRTCMLTKIQPLPDAIEEAILDLEYFEANKKLRRPDKFFSRL